MKISNHQDMFNVLAKELRKVLKLKVATGIYSKNRQQFEGWLQLEIIEILSEYFTKILPERDNIDITIGKEWAIELKVVSTNYNGNFLDRNTLEASDIPKKKKNITNMRTSIISDINKLENHNYDNKVVIFLVTPLEHNQKDWVKYHYPKLVSNVIEMKRIDIELRNTIKGVLYYGKVQ
jgi:hypothetical protein